MITWINARLVSLFALFGTLAAFFIWIIRLVKRSSKLKTTEKDLKDQKKFYVDLLNSTERQNDREHNHENRMEKINSSSLDIDDASRLLSSYPKENKATNAARIKGNKDR